MTVPLNHFPGSHGFLTQCANLVSGSRFILACIWVAVFFEHPHSLILRAIAMGGAASDLLDGRIARWTQSASRFGRWMDNAADIVFILTIFSCAAYAGIIPAYLPALVAASFAQYAADSLLIRGSSVPVKSRLGHWAGVFNYIFVIVLAWTPPRAGILLSELAPLIGLFYLAAMGERALTYRIVRGLHRITIKPAAGE
jgi:phosphatidylglycerophosphate synthase